MDQTCTNEINKIFNYDNVFLRLVGVSLCRTMTKSIGWINRFDDGGKVRVVVPFYLALVGDEKFVLDAFRDDIPDARVDLNTDPVPRGIITFNGSTTVSSEYANPNQYLAQKTEIDGSIRNIISKVKAVPVQINYAIEIKVASELDAQKCWQKIWDTRFNYMFFRYNYFGLPMNAFFKLPDDFTVEINRDDGMDAANRYKKLTFNLSIQTYYPIFKVNIDYLEVCDNDDEIDWEILGVPRPTTDFCQTIEEYYKSQGQKGITCNFNRVFWKNYYHSLNNYPAEKPKNIDETPKDPKNWPIENF